MPKRGGTRLVAKRLLDATAEDNDVDYFEKFSKRQRPNNDSTGQDSASESPQKQPDARAMRIARREAAKLSQTRGTHRRVVSSRGATAQLTEKGGNEDDDDDSDDEGGPDGVDHARLAQAMNQARNRAVKPTINGIGSRQRGNQHQEAERSPDNREDSQEEHSVSRSPDGEEAHAPRTANNKSSNKRGASSGPTQQENPRSHGGRNRPSQNDKTATSSPDEDESEAESPSEIDSEVAEDTAFVEAPQRGERTATVKVVINSMGGILKTLQHAAWTRSNNWARDFESYNNDDGQKTCKTRSGVDLMNEIRGLNDILDEATNPLEESPEDDHDFTTTTTAYLGARSADVQQHLIRIDQIVDEICSRKLVPLQRTRSEGFRTQVIKRRQALLRDLSRRLVPMLIITVKKACGICRSEDNRSKTTLYLDCFRLQFFLRPLAWADRLQKALERGLEQWTSDGESQSEANNGDGGGNKTQASERKARSTFSFQLAHLCSAVKEAEQEIQDIAAKEHEAEIKRQKRVRDMTRQREIAAERQREQDEQNRKDGKEFQAFLDSTYTLRSIPDPLKQLWDQSQAALPEQFRAAATQRAPPSGSSSGHRQRTTGAAHSQGDRSRNPRVELVSDSDIRFSDNHGPRSKTTVSNRYTSNNGLRQNPQSGLGSSQRARNPSRPWSREEEKAMIRSIRYKRNYDVVSMAQKLGRSEDDVARKAGFLKQAYREDYTHKGAEIPAWAL